MLPSARLFRSRWAALLWAGGIIWFALDVAQTAPSGSATTNAAAPHADDVDQAELEALSNVLTR